MDTLTSSQLLHSTTLSNKLESLAITENGSQPPLAMAFPLATLMLAVLWDQPRKGSR